MSLRIHTIRGLLWSAMQRTGGQAISLVAFVILSRLLQPSDFGVLAIANAFLLGALLIIEKGVIQAIVQREELSPGHLDAGFSMSMVLASALCLMTVVLAGPLAQVFHEPMLAPVLRCLSPILILAGLRATQTALLQRQMRFRELAVRTTLAESIGGLVGVVLALGGLGVWSLVGQAIARTIASVLVLWRVVEWRPRFNLTKRSLLDISSFGIPVVGDRVVTLVQSKADDLIIGLVLGATTLGYYTVGYRMLTYMTQLLSGTVQSVALPALARLQTDLGRFRRAFLGILQFLSLGAFPAFIGVAFVARDAVPLLFGPQWTPSIPVMQVLALAGAAKILQIASGTAFMASGRPGMQLRLNLVTTSLAVLGFALVVRNGIVAVATVHLWVAVLALPLHVLALRDIVGITLGSYARAIRTSTLGIVGMSVMLLILAQGRSVAGPSLGWLALTVVVGMLAYLSLTYFIDRGMYRQARAALQEGILSSPEERSAELGLGG